MVRLNFRLECLAALLLVLGMACHALADDYKVRVHPPQYPPDYPFTYADDQGSDATPAAGKLKVVNNCERDIFVLLQSSDQTPGLPYRASRYLQPAGTGKINTWTLDTTLDLTSGPNTGNYITAHPLMEPADIASFCGNCPYWSRIHNGPLSGTNPTVDEQRAGYMWSSTPAAVPPQTNYNYTDVDKYVAYCHPQLLHLGVPPGYNGRPATTDNYCAAGLLYHSSDMKAMGDVALLHQLADWGTRFEITINGGTRGNQDFPDLSTNYGMGGPTGPCTRQDSSSCSDVGDCVSSTAPIFYTIPAAWASGEPGCTGTDPNYDNGGICTEPGCTDAYMCPRNSTHGSPQIACPSSTGAGTAKRSYVLTFCPDGPDGSKHQVPVPSFKPAAA